ncbi:MAG: flagellar biosynthesis protein FlgE, partial [Marinobacter sp. 34-60-7]
MAFNTGLSGLRAASVDLDVTGNNIANASTVGFKSSKAQFGDLYASGFLSAGTNPIGDGVRVQDVKQSFGQGNISFTDNGLDLAISGDGFFILNNNGEVRYSRAGQFGIDKDGFIVNNQAMRVQGFTADEDGNLSGVRGDLQIETGNLAPRRTTNLQTDLNLDSRQSVLASSIRNWNPLTAAELQGENFSFEYGVGQPAFPVSFGVGDPISTIVQELASAPGVSASASTTTDVPPIASITDFATFTLEVVGDTPPERPVNLAGVTSLSELASRINDVSDTSISASIVGGNLRIQHSSGETLRVGFDGSTTDYVGNIFVNTDRSVTGLAGSVPAEVATAFSVIPDVTNAFNPIDQRTYNHATSTTIFDSLGNPHELTQFFVKEPPAGTGVGENQWSVYVQIDGELVAGTADTPYTAVFNESGELESIDGDPNGEIIVTDWTPKDANGDPNGADGPPTAAELGDIVSPIPEPPTTSSFVINLSNTTQYGAAFGVNDQRQNGYTTGRLSGLDVSDQGVIFARYTNGQSQSLGQVSLASFNNVDGLSPVGDTTWVETFDSGQPIIGAPDTGTLGSIKASSVEESNVDL